MLALSVEQPALRRAKETPAEPKDEPEDPGESSVTPTEPRGRGKMSSRRVNWTFMEGWNLLTSYDSEAEKVSVESISSDEGPGVATLGRPIEDPIRDARAKLKVKLEVILNALAAEEADEETRDRYLKEAQRLRQRSEARASGHVSEGTATGSVRAKAKAKSGLGDGISDVEMGLSTQELLKILPAMDKNEKKLLYKQLKKEREEEILKLFGPEMLHERTREKMKRPEQRRDGYSHAPPSKAAPSRSVSRTAAAPKAGTPSPASPARLEPPEPGRDVPAAVRKKKLAEFRMELYEAARDRRGRVQPSSASEVPTPEQLHCEHPFDRLLWGANAHAHWASCRDCGLKKALYYSVMHGALVASDELALENVAETYQTGNMCASDVILDTGCRTAVAGSRWHHGMQEICKQLNLPFYEVSHEEVFRFGAGQPALSVKAFVYPTSIYGQPSWVRMAVVENSETDKRVADCPGLIGPCELSRWKVQIDFSKLQIGVNGQWKPTVMSPSRHPILTLLEPHGCYARSRWETDALEELRVQLLENPYSFALVQDALADLTDSGTDDPAPEPHPSLYEDGIETHLAAWQRTMDDEALEMLDKLGPECFQTRAEDRSSDSGSDGSISSGESETSHADSTGRVSAEESDSSGDVSEAAEDHQEVLIGGAGDEVILGKGQKRRILAASKIIGEASKVEIMKQPKLTEPVPRNRKLRTGWKILEIFTWTCLLSRYAYSIGWEFLEPVTLPGWDLLDPKIQQEAWSYLERSQPDFIMIAWPCSSWSNLQNLNQKTPVQRAALRAKRREARILLHFARRVALWQQNRGGAVLGENPLSSRAWQEPAIIDGFGSLSQGVCDQCCYGLKHPVDHQPLRKSTRFVGPELIVRELRSRCPGTHQHHPIEGTVKTPEGTVSLSSWAGGYPLPLCKAIMKGVRAFMLAAPEKQVLALDEDIPEGIFQDGDEAIREEEERQAAFREIDEEEEEALEEADRHPIPKEVQRAVEFAHKQLGHPSRETLVRMLRMSGAMDDAVKYARRFQCDVCASRQPPKHPMASTPVTRPFGFNRHVHIDIKFTYDVRGRKYCCMSILDLGTVFHQAAMLKTRRSDYCAKKFLMHWIQPYGCPERLTHDQGGEWELSFIQLLESLAIPSTVTGAHAGWQLAAGERHGGILGEMLQSIISEHSVEGYHSMKLALSSAVAAKNMTITRDGFSPNQRVFGQELKFPSLTEEDVKPSFAEALDSDSEYARAHRMRITARLALIRMDVQEKVKRAILRKPGGASDGPFLPGTQVYFWSPKRVSKRYVRGGVWRGPATILVREGHRRYFASWRGRALLLAQENLRLATKEEMALNEPAKADAEEIGHLLRDPLRENAYRDQTHFKPPASRRQPSRKDDDPERKRARMMLKGTKSIQNLRKDRMEFFWRQQQSRKRVRMLPEPQILDPAEPAQKREALMRPEDPALEDQPPPVVAAPLPALEDENHEPSSDLEVGAPHTAQEAPSRRSGGRTPRSREPYALGATPGLRMPQEPVVPAHEVPVPEPAEQDWLDEALPDLAREEARQRYDALDDVPLSIKRKGVEMSEAEADRSSKRLRASFCATVAATTMTGGGANEWVSRYEVELLRKLTGLPVTAARIHRAPRKRFQRGQKMASRSRLSILLGADPQSVFIVNENATEVRANPRRRSGFEWKGMTIFYQTAAPQGKHLVYVEMPDGIYACRMTRRQANDFRSAWVEEVHDALLSEVMVLKLKESGKELDPNAFDADEKAAFKKADIKEWSEWIKNQVVRKLSKEEAMKVPRSCVFKAPLRVLRVNKRGGVLLPLIAKSRIIVPGHLDPHLGDFRTDAPTCAPTAVRMAKVISASRGWSAVTFDVTTAFLQGKKISRQLYIKAPHEGLPAIEELGWDTVQPGQLLQILKSAYGLTESPRLWYLEVVDRLKTTPLKELDICRCVFVAAHEGRTWAILVLHVDDGMLFGDSEDERFKKLRAQINEMFPIKEWKPVSEEPQQFLGVSVRQVDGVIIDDMSRYIKDIVPPSPIPGNGPLVGKEKTLFRQLLMRLRWPAQQTMPHMLYEVSALAQRVEKATKEDLREVIKLHAKFVTEAEEGRACLKYPKMDEKEKFFFLSYFDASLGKEADGKSQLGAMHFITTEQARLRPTLASVVDFNTTKSSRVVRSSMAAESSSLSVCVDRHLYGRIVFDMLLTGHRKLDEDWRSTMQVAGGIITDAKSLYDHLGSTAIPTERQTMLDLMVARSHLEEHAYELFWVPTHKQFADGLTKKMKNPLWELFCRYNKLSLKETDTERRVEEHRAKLRRDQRQRRKERLRPSPAEP